MNALGPDIYDALLADPNSPALLAPADSPWAELRNMALALIPERMSIVDLGCGPGRFASMLPSCNPVSYLGIDFAPSMVAEARRYNPQLAFWLADLRTCEIAKADVYVALEVLEHLDDDLALLARLQAGARIILSVPSFESSAHVRSFADLVSAVERYSVAIDIDYARTIPVTGRADAWFFLLSGVVR